MKKDVYKFYYIDKETRIKTQVNADKVIIECSTGESFSLYAIGAEILLQCDENLVITPKSSNQVALDER